MKLKFYQIDAFTSQMFSGNPAGVCPLEEWLPDATMQAIAAENNCPATAFFVAGSPHYGIRWFTPSFEIPLCGHGTLAASFVIMNELEPGLRNLSFDTKSGVLGVTAADGLITLDFPGSIAQPAEAPERLQAALGVSVKEVWLAKRYVVLLENETAVRALKPDFSSFDWLQGHDVVVTAAGDDCDFVSRYFAPNLGLPEDPVTGSTHCILTPFWAGRLGKSRLLARQLSARGGELVCELKGERVLLSGRCVKYLEGEISFAA